MATTANTGLHEFLEGRWWVMVLRGLLGIIFGVICFTSPAIAAFSLLIVFGAFSLADGILGLIASFGQARRGERWVWLAVEAVANLVIGVLVLVMPALSFVVLLLIIAIKSAVSGILLLMASIKLDGAHGQGFMAAAGLVSVAFAALLFVAPLIGVKVVIWWIGLWAILFGVLLIFLGLKLRSFLRR